MKIQSKDLQRLCAIVRAAGREVMAVYESAFESWLKDDATPLTEADLRADAVIREGLAASFPNIFILSEESAHSRATFHETFFLVDPLDGTKEFLKRNGEFTVNVALIHRGVAIAGVVFAPALDAMYFAAVGEGAWRQNRDSPRRLQVGPSAPDGVLRVIGSRSHGGDALAAWLGRLPHAHTFVPSGSSLKFCRIAEGAADIYPRFGLTSQWDTAAAQCVLEGAGGAVLDLATGMPLVYGLERPILNPAFVAMRDRRLWSLFSSAPSA